MQVQLMESNLWDNLDLRKKVLSRYCPPALLNLLGNGDMDKAIEQNISNYIEI